MLRRVICLREIHRSRGMQVAKILIDIEIEMHINETVLSIH